MREQNHPDNMTDHDQKSETEMKCMRCRVCSWIYDPVLGEPNQGVMPGTAWEAVPETFLCPECFLGKSEFDPV